MTSGNYSPLAVSQKQCHLASSARARTTRAWNTKTHCAQCAVGKKLLFFKLSVYFHNFDSLKVAEHVGNTNCCLPSVLFNFPSL